MDTKPKDKGMKTIMFSGGGTGGSVAPLLAVAEGLKREADAARIRLVFVGTKDGPEREMVAAFNEEIGPMAFVPMVSGKWRRYISWRNILDIFKIIAAWFQSFGILKAYTPDIIISAGAFVSVPLVWAAAAKKVPILIHQQDLRPGLANRLMAPWARAITTVFEKSLIDYGPRAILVGNPIRRSADVVDKEFISELERKYSLDMSKPLVLVFGGGLGASAINRLVFPIAAGLARDYQVIHLTGRGKMPDDRSLLGIDGYHVLEFMDNKELSALMSISDLAVTRAGLGTLTELSHWRKPAILIPIPDSHQEDNAAYFSRLRAAISLDQKSLAAERLEAEIRRVIADDELKKELANNIGKSIKRDAVETVSGIIMEIVGGAE